MKNNHPYITVSDLSNGSINLDNIKYVPDDIYKKISNYTITQNDIILSVAGTLGIVSKVPKILDNANLTENADKICDIKIDKDFLFYYLQTDVLPRLISKVKTNNAQPKLALKEVRNMDISYPHIIEQQKIAKFLSFIDKKIELLEQTLDFYQKHLEFNLNKFYSEIDYKKESMKEIFEPYATNLSINKLKDNNGIYALYGAEGFIKGINFFELEKPYISIIKDGVGVGRINLCKSKSSTLGTLQCLIPNKEYDIKFLYYYLNTIKFNKYIVGSTIPHIYFKDYSKEKLKIPPLNTQKIIGNYFYLVENKNNLIKMKIKKLITFKKALLQKMFC